MTEILFDTAVYIKSFRDGDPSAIFQRVVKQTGENKYTRLWLSAVVLEELYAGAQGAQARKTLEKLEKDFANANRLLVPLQSDWTSTGKILNKIGKKYGFEQVGRGRLTNDALIATSVARNGLTLLTSNDKDFKKISEFRPFNCELI